MHSNSMMARYFRATRVEGRIISYLLVLVEEELQEDAVESLSLICLILFFCHRMSLNVDGVFTLVDNHNPDSTFYVQNTMFLM